MRISLRSLLVVGAAVLGACQDYVAPEPSTPNPSLGTGTRPGAGGPAQRAALIAERANQILARRGYNVRVVGADFFTIGRGVPSFRLLRIGSRWTQRNPSLIIDESEWSPDLTVPQGRAAILAGFNTWDEVEKAGIAFNYLGDPVANPDFLDATVLDANGNCLTDPSGFPIGIIDATWPGPSADIVYGGWLPPAYFEKCLGSNLIIGVTWTFVATDEDGNIIDFNHDGYLDLVYVEQYFNPVFHWVTSGAIRLEPFFGPDPNRIDTETISVHEVGHALGVGHIGGPNPNQPFKLQPNGRIFDPEAVMNPFYVGGEKRDVFPLDVAALTTLYGRRTK